MTRREPPRDPAGMTQEEMIRDMYVRLIGDGTDARPGLDKRVDRLEQKFRLVTWGVVTALTAAVGVCVAWLKSKLTGKPE